MMLLALLLHSSASPYDPDVPLPWDMSHHFLGALQCRDAIAHHSLSNFSRALFESDLYPPGHSVILGSWLLAVGSSTLSLFLFRCFVLWIFVLAMVWAAGPLLRCKSWLVVTLGCLLLGCYGRFMALAGSYMVDAPAAVLALLSLAALAWAMQRRGFFSLLSAFALVSFTLLTKYNVGLPLIPAALALGGVSWIRHERAFALKICAVGLLALVVWALFLTVQVDGWNAFLQFASNRANSLDWSMLQRLRWYRDVFVKESFVWPTLGWSCLALALLALVLEHRPFILVSGVYVGSTLMALSRHPYLLERNLLPSGLILIMLAAIGGAILLDRFATVLPHSAHAPLLILGCAAAGYALLGSEGMARERTKRVFGWNGQRLEAVSSFIDAGMRQHPTCRVVGTFDAFSPGWVQILAKRIPLASRPQLAIGFPYPGTSSRTGIDPAPDARYLATVRNWEQREDPEFVIDIDVLPSSVFHDRDYELWNAWKQNLIRAIRSSPSARLLARASADSQRVVVEALSLENAPIQFGEGWGPEEPWGRWANRKEATLRIPAPAAGSQVELTAAGFDGQKQKQACTVSCEGEIIARFEVDPTPWQWHTYVFRLPGGHGEGSLVITFHFEYLDPGDKFDPRPRSLPFRSILVSVPGFAPPPREPPQERFSLLSLPQSRQ